MKKQIIASILVTVMLFGVIVALSGCSAKKASPKTFSSQGMSITLTDEFEEKEVAGYTVSYDSKNVGVLALKEPFTLAEGISEKTVEEYRDLVIKANPSNSYEKKSDGGLLWLEYDFTNKSTNQTYHYHVYVFKSKDAFWSISIAALKENEQKYSSLFEEWAKSITFSE